MTSRAQSDAAGYRERLGVAQNIEQMRKKLENTEVRQPAQYARLPQIPARRWLAPWPIPNRPRTPPSSSRQALASERDAYIRGWQADVSQQLSAAAGKAIDAREQLNKAKLRRQLVELHSEIDAPSCSQWPKCRWAPCCNRASNSLLWCRTTHRLRSRPIFPATKTDLCTFTTRWSIKFDTFPYSQYGMAEGTVRIVSPDSFTAQAEARNPTSAVPVPTSRSEPFYRARIAIDKVASA